MMITFVSQCEKKALNKTRRVLDAFADRIGDNAWQTVITQEGLLAVKKLLRKTASKNTAVSCHWIRSRSRTELVWVVGNKRKFDSEGRVPVNSTKNTRYTGEDENCWQHAHGIQIVAVLAALLHDIGKATIGFQNKLLNRARQNTGDPYRHEWLSFRLFQAMIHGCEDDESWLNRLADFQGFIDTNPDWLNNLYSDAAPGKNKPQSLEALPPLAQFIAWLIVTHHRLPTYEPNRYKANSRLSEQQSTQLWGGEMNVPTFYFCLKPFDDWVRNPRVENSQDFWRLKSIVMQSRSWQKAVARWARKARDHGPLRELARQPIADPFFMHISRLCLMLADHNYSSLPADDKRRIKADEQFATTLLANTDKDRCPKQALDEHLLGVGEFAKRVSKEIPRLPEKLEGLPLKYQPFVSHTKEVQYKWQNSAFKLAQSLNTQVQESGFFGVNMASTGLGKTLANARIMYALGDQDRGPRFTVALGLRVLTLQTGRALRERLRLGKEQLAILVGGAANRKLFELAQAEKDDALNTEDFGSESVETLLNETDSVDFDILPDEFATLLSDPKTRKLIYAPVVTCTVDHIIQASENSRGGRHIAPILRLLTSDLVLDEPDDFDQRDLPALSRLVHFAGLFGSKVLLSSATLTPDFVAGLFTAYSAGRRIWNRHMGYVENQPVCCAWFDEYEQEHRLCLNCDEFSISHTRFASKRIEQLLRQPPRRVAAILSTDLPPPPENEKVNMMALASTILSAAMDLHRIHAETCPATGKQVSIGLVRLANISPIIKLVQALCQQEIEPEFQVHLCCYHAKQLLLLRSTLEQKLDRILFRSQPSAIFTHPEIKSALENGAAAQHMFIIVASPVAEVGRDHDYDWAIIEPSSMRSIIQLVGRVWRHRPEKIATGPNLVILEKNIRALKGEIPAYTRPGFEHGGHGQFSLSSHNCRELITSEQLNRVDAVARICKSEKLEPKTRFADLEHAVMADLLNNPSNFVSAFWRENNGNHVSAHLQKISPFRESNPQDDFVCLPKESSPNGYQFTWAEAAWKDLENCAFQSGKFKFKELEAMNPQIQPWLTIELDEVLQDLADQLEEDDVAKVARQYASVRLDRKEGAWQFHPWLGFWS